MGGSVNRSARCAARGSLLVLAGLGVLAGPAASDDPAARAPEVVQVPEAGAAEAGDEAPTGEPEPPPAPKPPREPFDTVNLETPAYPGYRVREAFRVRVQTRFVPAAAFDGFDADLYQPNLRLRVTAPLSKRAVLQLTGRFRASVYDFHGDTDFFGQGPSSSDPFDDLFSSSLGLQAGFRLNDKRWLFAEDEKWSVLAGVFGEARWEQGAFSDGLSGGGALGLAYQLDDRLRVALGVNVDSRIDRGGVSVGPIADFRWNVTDRFTVRNRGSGVQLEYGLTPHLELFVAGFYQGSKYRLNQRVGLPGDLVFEDKAAQAGTGLEWKLSHHLRVNVEVGAVAWRQLKVRSHHDGTLSKETGDPSAYFDIRFELRP